MTRHRPASRASMIALPIHALSCFAGSLVPDASAAAHTPEMDPAAALVGAAQDGDPEAFAGLVREYKGRVFSTAGKYARNHHELEDLAQEIFIKVWKGLPGYRHEAPFGHWLMRLSVRACYDFLRRNRQRREKEISRDALLEKGHPAGEDPEWVQPPEEESAALLEVRRALALLPPRDQLILTLMELEERSLKETASLTGWSETNVKVRAFRARKSLRRLIERLRQTPSSSH